VANDLEPQKVAIVTYCKYPYTRDRSAEVRTVPMKTSLTSLDTASSGLRIGDLSACQALSAPSATRIVQGLVERRLLDRQIDPADKRASVIALTEAGRGALATIRSQTTDLITTRLGDLSRADRTKLHLAIEALERLAGVDPPCQPK
jgi:DNA-binding MarR family transcriptional regulator